MIAETQTEAKQPTQEEIKAHLLGLLEIRRLQCELQELGTRMAKGRADELNALGAIAHMTMPQNGGQPYQGGTPHVVTQEDLDNNPDLVAQGVEVGEEVIFADAPPAPKAKTLKTK